MVGLQVRSDKPASGHGGNPPHYLHPALSRRLATAYDETGLSLTSGAPMKNHLLLPALMTALLLSGCPDTKKLPKVPPSTPEPKAALTRATMAATASSAVWHQQQPLRRIA